MARPSARGDAVAGKLFAAFGLAIAATLTTSALGAFLVRNLQDDLDRAEVHVHGIAQVHDVRFELEHVVASTRGYLVSRDQPRLAKAVSTVTDARTSLTRMGGVLFEPAIRPLVREAQQEGAGYLDEVERMLMAEQNRATSQDAGMEFLNAPAPRRERLEAALSALVDGQEVVVQQKLRHMDQNAAGALLLILGLGTLAVILTGASSWFFGRGIRKYFAAEQAAVVARDDLLAILAHDLRSPLSAILMKATLLRKTAPTDGLVAKVESHATSIERTALRIESLISSLLDASTMEAGHFAVVCVPCHVTDPLRSVLEVFGPLASQKAITLTLDEPPEDLTADADRERALQVLSNLVTNAVKFTPAGGTVAVRAVAQGDEVRFSVNDSGPGIPPEHLPHLFNRYWKGEHGGRRGAGLGLFIAKGIVEAHGGRLWVESTLGAGSTFFFTLHRTAAVGSAPHGGLR